MPIPLYEISSRFIRIYNSQGRGLRVQLLGAPPTEAHICLAYNLAFPNEKVEIPPNNYQGTTPGLAYSAGIDSASAALILGTGVALYLNDGSRFASFAEKSILNLRTRGMAAFTVNCNVQNFRTPYGFPVDWAVAIPLIINANHFKIDSIATGTILESAYSIGREKYRDFSKHSHWTFWADMFAQANLPLNLVTAGLSEIATYNITTSNNLIAKSCIRNADAYCKICFKCYRRFATQGIKLPSSKAISSGVIHKHHLNILDYAYSKYGIKFYRGSKKKDLSFLERWYPKSLDLVPEKHREMVSTNIIKLVEPMNTHDIELLEQYKL